MPDLYFDEYDINAILTCRREILLPAHRPSFNDDEWALLLRSVVRPFCRHGIGDATPNDLWILYFDDDTATPGEWNIRGRDGWLYAAPLAFDVRSAWLPGDVMAYYPL